MDRLTQSSPFYFGKDHVWRKQRIELYMLYMFIEFLNGLSDHGTQSTSRFWANLHEALGFHLVSSATYHPQTEEQADIKIFNHLYVKKDPIIKKEAT